MAKADPPEGRDDAVFFKVVRYFLDTPSPRSGTQEAGKEADTPGRAASAGRRRQSGPADRSAG